jgi:hypothetical protein
MVCDFNVLDPRSSSCEQRFEQHSVTGGNFLTAIHALPKDGDELRAFGEASGEGVSILVVERSDHSLDEVQRVPSVAPSLRCVSQG